MSQIDLTVSAEDVVPVTKSDTVDLPGGVCRGILVATAGAVKITTPRGTERVIPLLAAGIVHPIQAKRVWDSGTEPTDISVAY